MISLDFSSLEKALLSLKKALDRSQSLPADEELRDAVIQRFEYSYELCWKMLKRQLEQESAEPARVDQLAFRDLLREASEKGYPVSFDRWTEYRAQRNLTAHAYDPEKARRVYVGVAGFYEDAVRLLNSLKTRSRGQS